MAPTDTFTQDPLVGFAQLHIQFAARVAAVLGLSRGEALRAWTPAYRLCGSRWPGDAEPDARALADAYARYLARPVDRPGAGCFSYQLEDAGRTLRLHFAAGRGAGTLRPRQREQRRGELLAVLTEARAAHPDAREVRGGSWLYNLPGYRALFPPAVLDGSTLADPRDELEFLALWGQFLRGDHTLYEPAATTFLLRLASAHDEGGLLAAFPLAKLDWRAPVEQIGSWLSRGAGRPRHPRSGPSIPAGANCFKFDARPRRALN